MDELIKVIHEQLLEYTEQLNIIEAEIVRKYKSGEDYSEDVWKANGFKLLQEECVKMMVEQSIAKQKGECDD